jgi:hypothetical protein
MHLRDALGVEWQLLVTQLEWHRHHPAMESRSPQETQHQTSSEDAQ